MSNGTASAVLRIESGLQTSILILTVHTGRLERQQEGSANV